MAEFLKVVRYDEARNLIADNFPVRRIEIISLDKALNRVLAEDVVSPEDIPSFNRSTVDGYAINAEDSYGSSESLPAILDFAATVNMGEKPDFNIKRGECAWIPTGGMLPEGSNAAVMVEYSECLDENTVLVNRPAGPWENVMLRGEDISQGEIVFRAGKVLKPHDIGLLASLGISRVTVLKPLLIGIISTGDEIIAVDQMPVLGQIRDVNSYGISTAVENCGSITQVYPIVKDKAAELKKAVEKGLIENDLLIISGGSSVGIADYSLEVMLSIPGAELLFHGIALKPGKPTMAVRVDNKLILGLPGHPVSALMIFNVLCSPALRAESTIDHFARLSVNIASQPGRDDFIPVKIEEKDNEYIASPLLGKSGLMNILARADGYINIAYEKQGLKAGEMVKVKLW